MKAVKPDRSLGRRGRRAYQPLPAMACGGVGARTTRRQEKTADVRTAAGAERRNGPSRGKDSEGHEPQERDRDETSPEGAERQKPPGGCETLEAARSRVRQARWIERGFSAPRTLKGRQPREGTARLEQKARGSPVVKL
jgi:hypothetical protein